jgi:hypothetical protein
LKEPRLLDAALIAPDASGAGRYAGKPARSGRFFDLAQRIVWLCANRCDMTPPDKPGLGKEEPPTKLSRSEEALRIIEEYAEHLRELIEKFRRRHLH